MSRDASCQHGERYGPRHHPLADGEVVVLGNSEVQAIAKPGHAVAHHAYLVTDRTRADEPWFVLTGDALLVGDAGRPDLHAHGEQTVEGMARALYCSITQRPLTLPDDLLLYPSHYSGSVCGRSLSANPASTIGFERRHSVALQHGDEDAFVQALLRDIPPRPEQQAAIVAANRAGRPFARGNGGYRRRRQPRFRQRQPAGGASNVTSR